MAQRIGLAVLLVVILLTLFTAYRNVLSGEAALRTMAESLARDAAGCRDCKATRIEGKRGVLSTSYSFTMPNGAVVSVTCKRPYLAFGDYACAQVK